MTVIARSAGGDRDVTLPIVASHGCGALRYYDGDTAYYSAERHAWIQARLDADGSVTVCGDGFDVHRYDTRPAPPVPADLWERRPALGTALDPDALRSWFDGIEAIGIRPILCIDFDWAVPAGRFVDTLIAAKAALGRRVLAGPNPWELDEKPEEIDEDD